MIIVSQDKTKILNFDNIEVIGIGNPLENNDGKFQILVDTTNDNEFSIAKYSTEERAKEVLNNLYNYKEVFEYFKYVPKDLQNKISRDLIANDMIFDVYEMPLE